MFDLKPYPEYKESDLPWLGAIPSHWNLVTIRSLSELRNERGKPQLPLLSVYRDYGVINRDSRDDNFNPKSDDLTNYKVVHPGDLVLNKMKTWQGSLGISNLFGIVSPAYIVCVLKGDFNRGFLHLLLRSRPYIDHYNRLSYGVRVDQWDMRYQEFKQIPVILPSLEEQEKIVTLLEFVDFQTKKYIRAKRRQIELLNEQKQAIIHQAVTRGLDPNVRLKPSGVEWIGDIPEHWRIAKLIQLTTKIGDGLHGTPQYVDESQYHFINGNNLTNGQIIITPSTRCVSEDEYKKFEIALSVNTLLLSINGTIGNVAYYQGESIILGKSAAYINCNNDLLREYLFFLLQSSVYTNFLQLEVTGTTILNLSLASIRSLLIILPPPDEQFSISSHLAKKIVTFDEMIIKINQEINLIREYRTRLIADVVTGKLDVRDVDLPALDEAILQEGLSKMEAPSDELEDAENLELTEEAQDADD